MKAAMKRKQSLEDSLSGHTSGVIEEERRVEVVGEDNVRNLLRECERYLLDKSFLIDDVEDVLIPEEINFFLQSSIILERVRNILDRTPDHFVNRLIVNSYNAGHNDFVLDTKNIPWRTFSHQIQASQERPLKLTINGPSLRIGNESYYGHYFLNGDVDNSFCAGDASFAKYVVHGNVSDQFGMWASSSYFEIYGRAGSACGHSSTDSIFVFHGHVGHSCGEMSKNCVFKTLNEKTLERLIEFVPPIFKPGYKWEDVVGAPSNNKIIFIHSDGSEELVRDYS